MSTDDVGETSANDLGGSSDMLSPMEATDADDVRHADGDEVVDPPDDWSGADKYGMSSEEQRQGESLDQRLAEELPDVTADDVDPLDADLVSPSDEPAPGTPEDGDSLFPVVESTTKEQP